MRIENNKQEVTQEFDSVSRYFHRWSSDNFLLMEAFVA